MDGPAKRPATYDDIVALPEHIVGELLDGELWTSPRPAARHARVSSVLGAELGAPFDRGHGGPGGWWILDEPELHLGGDVLVPDLAAWRQSRMPHIPDAPFFELSPDWVCEVLSPSTAKLDLARKLPKYAQFGIGHAWIIDPVLHTLQVFRRQESLWVLASVHSEDAPARAEPFEAVELELGRWWLDSPARSAG